METLHFSFSGPLSKTIMVNMVANIITNDRWTVIVSEEEEMNVTKFYSQKIFNETLAARRFCFIH